MKATAASASTIIETDPFGEATQRDPDAFDRQAMAAAVVATQVGAEETARLDPRYGRSSYVGDHAIGHVDPGARAVTIWLSALQGRAFYA
jgi:dihydroxyacetone kinase